MNKELIHKIAEQASTRKHVPPVWQFYDQELEDFVRMVVRECALTAQHTRWAVPPSQEQVARSILQQFGMKP